MTESMTPEAEAASARAAEQARLRKARREAKIMAGAENRLNKITGLGGGVPRDPAPAPSTTPAAATTHADPDEVDISEHFYQPQTTARIPAPSSGLGSGTAANPISDAHLRQMMLGLDNPTPPLRTGTPSAGMPGMPAPPPGMEDDPMMRMMMQMMGGGGAEGGGNPFAGMPGMGAMGGMPGMPGMGGFPGFPGGQTAAPAQLPNRSASLWRLLHALIALALGLYIALCTPFSGTKMSRDRAAAAAAGSAEERAFLGGEDGKAVVVRDFFWAFATAEAVLLGTRWFVERGRSRLGAGAGGSGILGMAVGFLPAGIRRKVEIAMRYGEVFGTVKGDVLVCVFVLGAAAWVRG